MQMIFLHVRPPVKREAGADKGPECSQRLLMIMCTMHGTAEHVHLMPHEVPEAQHKSCACPDFHCGRLRGFSDIRSKPRSGLQLVVDSACGLCGSRSIDYEDAVEELLGQIAPSSQGDKVRRLACTSHVALIDKMEAL
eukprot:4551675-Amphidinium_carterae.1